MGTWAAYNARRRAERTAAIIAQVRAQAAVGYSLFSAAREFGQSPRTLRRFLDRHGRHDLVEALLRHQGARK